MSQHGALELEASFDVALDVVVLGCALLQRCWMLFVHNMQRW